MLLVWLTNSSKQVIVLIFWFWEMLINCWQRLAKDFGNFKGTRREKGHLLSSHSGRKGLIFNEMPFVFPLPAVHCSLSNTPFRNSLTRSLMKLPAITVAIIRRKIALNRYQINLDHLSSSHSGAMNCLPSW